MVLSRPPGGHVPPPRRPRRSRARSPPSRLAVARAEGADLPDAVADELVAEFAAYPEDLGSSILFDHEAGRPLEWDARNGVVAAAGRQARRPDPGQRRDRSAPCGRERRLPIRLGSEEFPLPPLAACDTIRAARLSIQGRDRNGSRRIARRHAQAFEDGDPGTRARRPRRACRRGRPRGGPGRVPVHRLRRVRGHRPLRRASPAVLDLGSDSARKGSKLKLSARRSDNADEIAWDLNGDGSQRGAR